MPGITTRKPVLLGYVLVPEAEDHPVYAEAAAYNCSVEVQPGVYEVWAKPHTGMQDYMQDYYVLATLDSVVKHEGYMNSLGQASSYRDYKTEGKAKDYHWRPYGHEVAMMVLDVGCYRGRKWKVKLAPGIRAVPHTFLAKRDGEEVEITTYQLTKDGERLNLR